MYELIFIGLFLTGWLICAYVPWLAVSVATHGHAGLATLPLCLLAGVAGGLAVPLLILDDVNGIWLSFVVAFALPSLLMAARRFALPALRQPAAVTHARSETSRR